MKKFLLVIAAVVSALVVALGAGGEASAQVYVVRRRPVVYVQRPRPVVIVRRPPPVVIYRPRPRVVIVR